VGATPRSAPATTLNKRRRNTVILDGSLPDQLIRDLIEDSYDLVCDAPPKRVRNDLATGAATRAPQVG